MVNTRMKSKIDNVEKEVTVVQMDITRMTENVNSMREILVEMQAWMRCKDEEAKTHRKMVVGEEGNHPEEESSRNRETSPGNELSAHGGNTYGE